MALTFVAQARGPMALTLLILALAGVFGLGFALG